MFSPFTFNVLIDVFGFRPPVLLVLFYDCSLFVCSYFPFPAFFWVISVVFSISFLLIYFVYISFIIFLSFFLFFYCSGFCLTLKWISHGFTCVPHPDPPSHLPLPPIPLGLPSASGPSACLMHPTWAGDLFHPR